MTQRSSQADRRGIVRPLLALMRPQRLGLLVLVAVTFTGSMIEAAFLVLVTNMTMAIAEGRENVSIVPQITLSVSQVALLAAGMLVLRLAMAAGGVWLSSSMSSKVLMNQRERLTRAYLWSDLATLHEEAAGRLQQLLAFAGQASAMVGNALGIVTASLSLVAFLATALIVSPAATVMVVVGLAALSAVLVPVRRWIQRRANIRAQRSILFAQSIAEFGALAKEMQTFGVRDKFLSRINELSYQDARGGLAVDILRGEVPALYSFLAYGALLAGVHAAYSFGTADLTVIGAVLILMLRSLSYGQNLQNSFASLAAQSPFLHRVEDAILNYASARAPDGDLVPRSMAPVRFTDVSFAYGQDRPEALANLNLLIPRGECLGVIGPSGAGKSTLVQLLLGLREPTLGVITVDDVPLSRVRRDVWTSRVSFVPQDAQLTTGTAAENIRFFREGLDNEALIRAATRANILKDIQGLPHGFDTHLGERGGRLSGGQRQRLSIARALVGEPELLILDEPTSALDGESEALIRDTLADLRGEVTVVLVAHRMSTLDACDRIMVVEGGKVTGLGPPATLRQTNAFYRNALAIAGMD